ncbi:alpha/beta hydrolase [Maribacter confluentis]|uniref:Alpha/beta hydrolase n=1 Tax=Maribacter confluentis TaxID=1656093 RepID=A0ABT8RLG0_9FLAO|nr:alpha/beta hydrolase [Maribacter confluentis]MDO1511307.1 alpha/beta hydrolase [Maribacter confluentis]
MYGKSVLITCLLLFCSIGGAQENTFVSFDGVPIVYTDEGEGKPVLLIHGFINTRKSWDNTELKKDLLANGYRVIIPDLRGNGESGKPQKDAAYAGNSEIMDLKLLMDHLRITAYLAIGYSRGSILLAKLLTEDKRISKAVLGGMGIDFINPQWDRRIMFANAFNGDVNELTIGAVNYAKSINADLRSLHLQQKYQPVTLKKELKAVKTEVLVVRGDQDLENGNSESLSKAFKNGKFAIVKGDHNKTYKTKGFASVILQFLE